MEELHRTQPDAPFGWVLLLQELTSAWRARRRAGRTSGPVLTLRRERPGLAARH